MPRSISPKPPVSPAEDIETGADGTTSVITSLEELEVVGNLWRSQRTSPFVDFEFFRFIVHCRREHTAPFVVTLWSGDAPVALLIGRLDRRCQPLKIGYAKLGELPVRQATFIADGFIGATSPANLRRLLAQVNRSIRASRIAVAVFEQVEIPSTLRSELHGCFGRLRCADLQSVTRHWRMALPPTWMAFWDGMTAKHRYWLKHLPKTLDREFAGRWSIERYTTEAQVDRFLDGAETIARSTYQRQLGAGFVRNDEYTGRVTLDCRSGRLRGYCLGIDGEAKAFWYCVLKDGVLHMIATAFDPAFRRYELGTVLLLEIVRDHSDGTVASIDFGIGDALYKQRFGTEFRSEAPLHVFSNSPRGVTLHFVLSTLSIARRLAKATLDRLAATQKFKTSWRRRLTRERRPQGKHAR